MGFTILDSIKLKIAEGLSQAIGNNVDGKDIMVNLDELMDDKLGKEMSEMLQRGVVTTTLLEMLEGLWEEDRGAMLAFIKDRYKEEL